MADSREFSDYYNQLEAGAKERYREKLDKINLTVSDPYTFGQGQEISEAILPDIEYPDIYNFLINTPSPFTKEELKAYKSLDGYKYLLAGWVGDIALHVVGSEAMVVTAKVRHSQSVTASPLQPWIAAKQNGIVICAHCTCMAGLGEACSHIAALLFAMETCNRLNKDTSCTSRPCAWLPPNMSKVKFAPISDIDFSAPVTKRKRLVEGEEQASQSQSAGELVPSPSQEEVLAFFNELSENGKPALLAIVPDFCDSYIVDNSMLSAPLSLLFDYQCTELQYDDLMIKCESVFESLAITPEQARNIEVITRAQALSKVWFRYRAGRVTASRFKAAVHTNPLKPSKSLIKAVCYPEMCKFSNRATRWGCEHERTARDAYTAWVSSKHLNLAITDKGLVIHPDFPYLGASPDGFVKCRCCGCGVIEVKCPFSCRDRSFLQATEDSNFCLEHSEEGFALKRKHTYFYQVQLQMKLCDVNYCDFVIWRESELVVIRIERDEAFITDAIDKATTFFKCGILPELVGKWFSRLPVVQAEAPVTNEPDTKSADELQDTASSSSSEEKWCYCKSEASGTMIGCENDDCEIKWFHVECLRLSRVPKGKWYCHECKDKAKKKK